MAKKHYIVRPKSAIQIDGEMKTPDDQVAHIITDIDLYTLCSSIIYQRFECDELNDGEVTEEPEPEPVADALVGVDQAGADSAESVPANSSAAKVESVEETGQDDQLDLIAYWIEQGMTETIAEALSEATQDESVKDRELIKTVEGLRQWIAKHKDLTDLPKIGKTRSEEILRVLSN